MSILAGLHDSSYSQWSTASRRRPGSSPDTANDTAEWRVQAVQIYFADPKALKIIQLVVLQVMWIYNIPQKASVEDDTQNSQPAVGVVTAVDPQARIGWAKTNPQIFRKLADNVLNTESDARLRCMELVFVGLLMDRMPEAPNAQACRGSSILAFLRICWC